MPPLSLFSASEKAKPRPEPSRINALTKFASTSTLPTPTSAANRSAIPFTPLRAVRAEEAGEIVPREFRPCRAMAGPPCRGAHGPQLFVVLLGGATHRFEFFVDVAIDVAPPFVASRVAGASS